MGRKGVMVTVVQRNGRLQVVQFVGGGSLFAVVLAVLVRPEIKLAEPPFVMGQAWVQQGNMYFSFFRY
jgi:hypothetical protein